MRDRFMRQMELLHREIVAMGELCEEAIRMAISALINNDTERIEKVFVLDSEIDRKEREIESLCLKLLLQQQPVAGDLREISSALKMISDMERIGDQASDIAQMGRYIIGHAHRDGEDARQMAAEAIHMVKNSIRAFVERDLTLARAVITYDDVVDEWFSRIRSKVIAAIAETGEESEYYIDLLMIAKYLERIADHATNIAEWVEYAITGTRSKNGVFSENGD